MRRRLTDSEVYQQMAKTRNLETKIKNFCPVRDKVSFEKMSDTMEIIRKKFNFNMKADIMELLNNDKIIIVYNRENAMPRFMNVFGKKVNGEVVVLVDITAYANIDKNGNIDIFPRTLYGLLQNAMILYYVTTKFHKIEISNPLATFSARAYTKLVCGIMDKILGININPTRSDIAYYLTAKYFLINVYGYEGNEGTINDFARNATINNTELNLLKEIENELDTKKLYSNFMNFMEEISRLDGFHSLQFRSFMEQYLRQYGEASLLSVDYLPSFLALIMGTNVSAQLNKDYIISSICSKEAVRITTEFAKII